MLHLHRCDRTDALLDGLATLLRTPLADPFAPEVVAVPSRGVERWIAQSLSATLGTGAVRADGVCANVRFPSPSRLMREVTASACGIAPDDDPWDEQRLVWPVLAAVDACRGEPWCAVLGRHLAGEHGEQRRVAVAQKLARLFTAYGAQRPALIRDWVAGGTADGAGGDLADDLRWQALLWRDLRERVGTPSPAERLDTVRDRLAHDPDVAELPARISVFGATRVSADEAQVLAALALRREVHLWLPHPSPALWARVGATGTPTVRRHDDPTASLPRHPLLASLGRDARELQLTLAAVSPDSDEALASDDSAGTLLAAVQADIRADHHPDGSHELRQDDRSIAVHACHGAHRQVEVLREVVLGALADDPTLEPRDILVMCPDIEAYAPLITATFGGTYGEGGDHPGRSLRIKLADRSLRQTNPVLAVLARLLALADSRMTASDVLDLAALPAVRRRFGFGDDALERLGEWVREAGVRWGLDAAARAPYGLDAIGAHTWRRGLDRVLLGVAMDTEGLALVGDTLPLDGIASNDAELVGALAEFVDRLADTTVALTTHRPAAAWQRALAQVIEDFTAAPADEPWQLESAHDQLAAAFDGSADAWLRLADVRALLDERLRGRATRANFRTGDLTFATLVPMRSVPHRMVCVLGLDDGAFPRHPLTDGDDVLARDPLTGERDLRSEDRQLLLDAVLAARERLVLLYTGADPRTGAIRPPAAPLGELFDTLDATAGRGDGGPVRDQVVRRHPLQPFDPRNFATPEPFSFDAANAAGARALLGERLVTPAVFAASPPAAGAVELDALIAFCEHPVRAYVHERLGLTPDEADTWSDDLPIEVDPLGRWTVGDWMLAQRINGLPAGRVGSAARQLPELPLGPAADAVLAEVTAGVEAVLAAARPYLGADPLAVPVSVAVPGGVRLDGIRLDGTVPDVRGDTVVRLTYSSLGAKHRIRAWVQLLVLCAAVPDRPWRSVVIARKGAAAEVLELDRVEPAAASRILGDLVALYAAGRERPLPLPLKASYAYALLGDRGTARDKSGLAAARREWRRKLDDREIGEFEDPYHTYLWGPDAPFDELLREPHDGEPPNVPHLFGQLALRLWSPFLRRESA